MGEYNFKENDLYIEVADLSKREGFIKFPVYQSENFIKDEEEVIPLTAYYFEALKLCIEHKSNFDRFDKLVDCINKLWFACNRNNIHFINEFIRERTKDLRKLVQQSDKNEKGIYSNVFDNLEYYIPDDILDYYNDWVKIGKNKKIVDDFEKHIGPCVAIAMPICFELMDESNCYLSISGALKDYIGHLGGKILPYISRTYNAINNLLEYIFGFRFIECHLNDNTRRYTYLSTYKEIVDEDFNGRVLVNPVKFSTDYKKYYDIKEKSLGRHYSCCEKKIINYMNFVNTDYKKLSSGKKVVNILTSYEFRIEMPPCRMCRPALIGCYFIGSDYFSFLDFFLIKYKRNSILLNPVANKKEPLIIG